ncbi:hypothetical protein CU098_011528 [Rhizopus stolonifer]|uniref:Homeobox domain-containing protein n=1 Tax=Rhizopus stolonifer TaxID=4846 RepID=A0A367KHU1_RHIST|nr:hypothetical protein CU098_011528 [Rhizopus stolonifer]
MSPEMLMQPFEQSFNVMPTMVNHGYFNSLEQADEENAYFFGGYHPYFMEGNEDFRTSFYNPFEIKHRRRTSRAQLKVLEKSFSENPKPNATVRRILAQQLDMTPRGVQIWFQNRRAKAKLQRRKSGEKEETTEEHIDKQNNSPILFTQFFNNLKNWDSNARSIATQAAASCMFNGMEAVDALKMDDLFKSPIHPLAPVIESTDTLDFSMPSHISNEEWRRKSCHALGSKEAQQTDLQENAYLSWPLVTAQQGTFQTNYARRMTADQVLIENSNSARINSQFSMLKSSHSETNTPRWSHSITPPNASIDLYSNFNYSPISQELTPMLSTGSPVSSIDGNCYDPCFDLIMPPNASS